MRHDFITDEILQNYKFFGIQFNSNQYTHIHGDDSISIPELGTRFGKKIGKKNDLFVDETTLPAIKVPSFGTQVTLIFKYNLDSYYHRLFLGRFFGFCPVLYDQEESGYYYLSYGGSWWRRKYGFGNKYNTNYELAIEVKPGQFKMWLNGILSDRYTHNTIKALPSITFGFDMYHPQFYLNDIFCINKSDFLPDQYTVNWNEPWYELMYKHIYTHHNEAFYSK